MLNNVQVVVNPYENETSHNRKGIIIEGVWENQILDFINENNIKALYLNSAKGWEDSDYSFLSKLDMIEELNIISSNANNLSFVECMTSLKELSITSSTKDIIDFSNLPNLEKCYLYWWKGVSNIEQCNSLKHLYLDKANLKEYSELGALKNLDSLTLANCQIESIAWIEQLSNLVEFALLNCKKLSDFSPIKSLKTLKKITISGSKKMENLDFLSALVKLEVIIVSDNGELSSLSPLVGLRQLKALSFAGNTVIKDGNLSVLEKTPNLSMLMFRSKKHYSHKLIKKWDWKNFDSPGVLLQKI